MRRKFADLNLKPSVRDFGSAEALFEKACELGYSLVAASFPPDVNRERVAEFKRLCSGLGMDFAARVDLAPNSRRDLLRQLGRLRRRFEIVGVVCVSKAVARQAAKDRRVDLLVFPEFDPRKRFFDPQEAELASNALASLEVCMSSLLLAEGARRARLLSFLRREVAVASKFCVPVVVSSGASEPWLLRKPRELAVLATLFDMDFSEALNAVSAVPFAIVRRNREKLSSRFVAPGIRLVRRGKDC